MPETVRHLMGEFYLNIGNYPEAEAAFRAVNDLGGLRALAKIYVGNGEFTKAVSCQRATGEDWTDGRKRTLAHEMLDRGQLRGAEEAFSEIADPFGLQQLGERYMSEGKLGEAMRVFQLAKFTEGLQTVGHAYLQKQNAVDAHRAFRLANDVAGLKFVVAAYLSAGRLDSAKALARTIGEVIETDALVNAGWHNWREKRLNAASELFLEAKCIPGLKSTAQALLTEGDTDGAVRIAEDIVALCDSR